jgi:acetyl esterase/lipase
VSPLQARLHGLPPALLSVGTDDPLVDDSVFLAARWQLAGSPVRLDLYQGGFHAFDLFPWRVAEVCAQRQWGFLQACASGAEDPLVASAHR